MGVAGPCERRKERREKGSAVAPLPGPLPGRLGSLPLPMLAAWGQHRHVPVAL